MWLRQIVAGQFVKLTRYRHQATGLRVRQYWQCN